LKPECLNFCPLPHSHFSAALHFPSYAVPEISADFINKSNNLIAKYIENGLAWPHEILGGSDIFPLSNCCDYVYLFFKH
jgi:hypothetical protein